MRKMPDLKPIVLAATQHFSNDQVLAMMPEPVIILSAPRSGSTLLFEQLSQFNHFWTIGGESHAVFQTFPNLRAQNPQLDSMALDEQHADPETCDLFRRCFLYFLRTPAGVPYLSLPPGGRPAQVCLLEKTPRNALNIPFLLKVFPGARFIYLKRNPKQTVSSLIEAWMVGLNSGQFITFRDLPGWPLPGWCFVLPEGWRDMAGKSLAEIAAFQWAACNLAIIEGLSELPTERVSTMDYKDLIADPAGALNGVNQAFGFKTMVAPIAPGQLPLSRTTVSTPHPDKWKRHENEIASVSDLLSEVEAKVTAFSKRN